MPKLLSPHEPPAKSGGKGFVVFLLVAGLAAGGWFGWDYWKKRQTETATDTKAPQPAKTNATAAAAPAGANTNGNPISRAAATLSKWAERQSDQEPAKPIPAKPAPVAATTPAALGKPASAIPGMPKVQAIFYRLTDPSAIIAGQTVKNGDEIGGAKVIEIKRQSVRMLLNGDMHDVTIK